MISRFSNPIEGTKAMLLIMISTAFSTCPAGLTADGFFSRDIAGIQCMGLKLYVPNPGAGTFHVLATNCIHRGAAIQHSPCSTTRPVPSFQHALWPSYPPPSMFFHRRESTAQRSRVRRGVRCFLHGLWNVRFVSVLRPWWTNYREPIHMWP